MRATHSRNEIDDRAKPTGCFYCPSPSASELVSIDNGDRGGSQCAPLTFQSTQESKGDVMPSISGSFSGKITNQVGLPLNDQPNHQLGIGEVNGIQHSLDPLWNNSKITYWGVNDLINGEGSQTG